jgi:WD40 repeat protein
MQAYLSFYWVDDVTLIAAASDAVFWWDVMASQLLERVARPDQAAFFVDAAFGPGGERLAAVAQDENVYIWDAMTARWASWPAGPSTDLNHVALSPDGRLVAATTSAGELVLWDAATAERLTGFRVTPGDVAAVRFSPDGRLLAVGGWDSVIGLWGIP